MNLSIEPRFFGVCKYFQRDPMSQKSLRKASSYTKGVEEIEDEAIQSIDETIEAIGN